MNEREFQKRLAQEKRKWEEEMRIQLLQENHLRVQEALRARRKASLGRRIGELLYGSSHFFAKFLVVLVFFVSLSAWAVHHIGFTPIAFLMPAIFSGVLFLMCLGR